MGKFQDFMIEEGFFDCVFHGMNVGYKAYAKKRKQEAKKDKKEDVKRKYMSAEGEELKDIIKKMIEDDLTIDKNGEVINDKQRSEKDWLREHVCPQRRCKFKKNAQGRLVQTTGA